MDGACINAWILFGEVEGIIFYLRSKNVLAKYNVMEVKISLKCTGSFLHGFHMSTVM